MNKRVLKCTVLVLSVILVIATIINTGKVTEDELRFKKVYEDLNGKQSNVNKKYRIVNIPDDNNVSISTFKEINKMVKDKKTFYVYFGFESCPWCRSMVSKMIEISKKQKIKKIYYVDVRPGTDSFEGDLRDEYGILDDGSIYLERQGSSDYHEFLKLFDSVLNPYSRGQINSLDGTKYEGQKRLGAPNIIYVEKGIPKKLITGISKNQKDAYMKLSEKIISDQEKAFNNFFKK